MHYLITSRLDPSDHRMVIEMKNQQMQTRQTVESLQQECAEKDVQVMAVQRKVVGWSQRFNLPNFLSVDNVVDNRFHFWS